MTKQLEYFAPDVDDARSIPGLVKLKLKTSENWNSQISGSMFCNTSILWKESLCDCVFGIDPFTGFQLVRSFV